MPAVNVLDELFIVASPERIREVVCDTGRWAEWLPGIALSPHQDRGRVGVRWTVSGTLTGTAEVWLEEHGDGTIVHTYLRADPTGRAPGPDPLRLKRAMFHVKDELEGGREPGTARVPLHERVVSASDSGQVARDSKGAASDGRRDHLTHPDLR